MSVILSGTPLKSIFDKNDVFGSFWTFLREWILKLVLEWVIDLFVCRFRKCLFMIDNDILNQAANYRPLYITKFPLGNSVHVLENHSMLEKCSNFPIFVKISWVTKKHIFWQMGVCSHMFILPVGITWESRGKLWKICGKVTWPEKIIPN